MNSYSYKLFEYLEKLNIKHYVIKELCSLFQVKIYDKGELFALEDNTSNKIAFIVNGVFHMFIIDSDGNKFTKNFILEDQFVLSTFSPVDPNEVSIETLCKSIVLEAKFSEVLKLYEKYPELKEKARVGMEKRFLSLHKRLDSFATKDAKDRYEIFKKVFGEKENIIPQYLIASYLGITPTQLSRIRKS